jgi:hypothetical protein
VYWYVRITGIHGHISKEASTCVLLCIQNGVCITQQMSHIVILFHCRIIKDISTYTKSNVFSNFLENICFLMKRKAKVLSSFCDAAVAKPGVI